MMEDMAVTKLFHQTLTNIVLKIDDLKQYEKQDVLDGETRDKLQSELDYQYDQLYQTVKELIFLDKPEEIDRMMIQTLTRYEMPF